MTGRIAGSRPPGRRSTMRRGIRTPARRTTPPARTGAPAAAPVAAEPAAPRAAARQPARPGRQRSGGSGRRPAAGGDPAAGARPGGRRRRLRRRAAQHGPLTLPAAGGDGSFQRGRPQQLGHQRQPLGERRHEVGVGTAQLVAQRAPDRRLQRIDGPRDRGRGPRPAELAGPGGQRSQRTAGLQSPQVGVIAERSQHRGAQPGAVPGEVSGQDRLRRLQRGILEQRQQPALGQIL